MKGKLCLLLLLSLVTATAFAQTRIVTGRVVSDSTRDGLPGVSVTLRGARTSTATGTDGRYSITIPQSGGTLVFSSVGYNSQEVSTGNRSTIDITLATSAGSALSDVVVVGYQTVRRRDLTGSVSSVGARQIKDVPLSSAAEAIQGRLAGVQVTSSEGAPGADVIIRVRGGGSITQDNSPLYIVDGVQVENALSVIAPQDIASVDVLKDASTTAIYGARGANGVVLITTKGGRSGKVQVSYSGQAGFRELPKTMKVLSPYDFVVLQYERAQLVGGADSTNFANTYGRTWDTLQVYKNIPAINWQEEVFGRRAAFQNHNVSMSGGSAGTSFNLSLTANNEDGIQLESGFDRYLANFRLDTRLSDKVRMGFNIRYLDQSVQGAGTTNSGTRTTNRLRHTITYRPFEIPIAGGGIDDFDEAYYLASAGATNPVLLTQAEYRRAKTRATYLTGYVNIVPVKNLTFRSTVGYDNTAINQTFFFGKITNTARNAASLPVAQVGDQSNRTINLSNTLQYGLSRYKGQHDISVLVGQEIVERRASNTFVESRYLPADISPEKALANLGLSNPPSGQANPFPSSTVNPLDRIFSLFGRINYAYGDRYLATFNLRADRSSKFSSENGTLVFPSGSVAWRFSQEAFMKGAANWLSDGKLRFGYGAVGNNRIGDLLYLQLYGVSAQYAFNHSLVPGFAPTALANPSLRWEKNITRNLGLDLAFFRNRLQLTVDAYKNSANDLLLAAAIPPTTGYSTQIQNVGATSNRGIEFQLNAIAVQKRDFTWNSNFNISFNRNRVESLGGPTQITRNSGWQGSDGVDDYLVKVGQPVGLMYGFVTDGFYKVEDFNYNATTRVYTLKTGVPVNSVYGAQPGTLKWKDLNGDGVITPEGDRQVIGDANPNFTGGWNNQFQWKNFDASVFVNFVVGNDIYNANKEEWSNTAFPGLNTLDIMKDRFRYVNDQGVRVYDPTELAKLNSNATIWSPVRLQRWWLHSWDIEDGSYLRINNVTLGYTLPKRLLERAKISSLRVFATVNNLATISGYSGYDPDVTARRSDPLTPGVDFAAYPRSRTWVAGVNLTF